MISEIGPYHLDLRSELTPFEALLRSIVHQQLSGYAATSILNRIMGLYEDSFPRPMELSNTPDDTLRSCGLSRTKIRAVKDLAGKVHAYLLPDAKSIQSMTDEQIIDAYSTVFGIGRWTVEMLLIFNLGRQDVLAVGDLGIRRGYKVAFETENMPTPSELKEYGKRWKPYRSVASWYLWQAADPKFRSSK